MKMMRNDRRASRVVQLALTACLAMTTTRARSASGAPGPLEGPAAEKPGDAPPDGTKKTTKETALSGIYVAPYLQIDIDYRPGVVVVDGWGPKTKERKIGDLSLDYMGFRFLPLKLAHAGQWGGLLGVGVYVGGALAKDSPAAAVLTLELAKTLQLGWAVKISAPKDAPAVADGALVFSLSVKNLVAFVADSLASQ